MAEDLFKGDLPRDVPLKVQIACVQREIAMRERVYPRWIGSGKITAEKAADELCAMRAALKTLEEVQ